MVVLSRKNTVHEPANLAGVDQARVTQDKQNDLPRARSFENKAAAWQLNLAAGPMTFAQRLTEILDADRKFNLMRESLAFADASLRRNPLTCLVGISL